MRTKIVNSLRLLCAADLHLGRRFPAISGEKEKREPPIIEAWKGLVSMALDPASQVDAVILAGDIFDSEENLYEAVFHFEKGLVALANKKIPVLAVAGNHDANWLAMRNFFSHHPLFYCLGKHGVWETLTLALQGRKLRIDGWSFPGQHSTINPMQSVPLCLREEIAIGILHCECPGQKESRYAPVEPRDFAAAGHRAWILGHVHIPHIISEEPHVFYCGSLQGLDSSEHSVRGVRILDIDGKGDIESEFIPIAPLLWHQQKIVLDPGLDSELQELLEKSLRDELEKRELGATHSIGVRFFLEGRTRNYQALIAKAKELEGVHIATLLKDSELIYCWIEKIVIEALPAFDLALLAQGETLISQLARTLLALQEKRGGEQLQRARAFLEQKSRKVPHLASETTEEDLHKEILRSGFFLLDELMKQKESGR